MPVLLEPRAAARRALPFLAWLLALLAPPAAAQNATELYVHDSQGQLGIVDVDNGQVTIVGNMGVVMTDIAFAPDVFKGSEP